MVYPLLAIDIAFVNRLSVFSIYRVLLVVFRSCYRYAAVGPAGACAVVEIDCLAESSIIDIIFRFCIFTISTLLDSNGIRFTA